MTKITIYETKGGSWIEDPKFKDFWTGMDRTFYGYKIRNIQSIWSIRLPDNYMKTLQAWQIGKRIFVWSKK